uniref:Thioredoxin H-type-like n=1 Tax=Rhizophora mucronata TaxID=61149 RepID=A0A2P2LZJ6_RHIMU
MRSLAAHKIHLSDCTTESTMAVIFFCSSGLLAPTSLSNCCPSLRKKKVGVALMSQEVLKSVSSSTSINRNIRERYFSDNSL